jgi:hypothetical protein
MVWGSYYLKRKEHVMLDTNTVNAVSGAAHVIINMVTALIIGILSITAYIGGFFHGKKTITPK